MRTCPRILSAALPDDLAAVVERVAARYDGNTSMALRHIVSSYSELAV